MITVLYGRSTMNCKSKGLVLFLLILNVTDFCQSKAFLEESDKDRGKRSYNYAQSAGIHQTYGSQSNAEHWMEGDSYQPEVDGQPIYVPVLDQPGSYQEFLDAYYKAYTPAWNLATPVPYTYSTKTAYENSGKTVVNDISAEKNSKYTPSLVKESEFSAEISTSDYYDAPESEDYDNFETIDKTMNEFSDEDAESINENFDSMASESNDLDDSEESVEFESLKKPGLPKTKPEDKQYDLIVKTVKQQSKPKNDKYDENIKMKQKPKIKPDDEYGEPTVVKNVKPKTKDQYDEPAVHTVKQKPKTKPKDDQYDEPAVVKTVKQKPKTKPKDDQYDEPAVVKTVKQKPQTKPKDQYDEPAVVKTVKQKPKTKPKDQYKPAVVKSVKPKPKDDEYDEPAVKNVKQKPKTNVKDVSKKPSKLTPKPQLNSNYEIPQNKIKEIKPNKVKNSKLKYGDRMSQGTKKKSKGKRRKQYSKTNQGTVGKTIENSDSTTDEMSQLSKKGGELYPSKDKQIEIKQPVVQTDLKEKPVKTKVNSDVQYEPVKGTLKYNEGTPIKSDTKNKPAKANEKVTVKDSQNRPVKSAVKETVKSDSKDKSVKIKENGNIKYPQIDAKEQLNDDLTKNEENVNTDSPLEGELNSSALKMTNKELAENMSNFLSTVENDQNSEDSTSISSVVESDSIIPNVNDFRGLSSMNSNIWSMLFNPKAEQNRLKLKRCITRSNETGFCTYIQNCEVPQIATSLEQLLNNACVIDDIFIGVCCPEFPVETVKVHWDQTPSDFDNQIEDEFGNNAEDCGVRSNESSELQSWPWKAPLVSMSNGKIFCGGVVVSEDHILTAAHCTTKIPKNQILVRLGQYDDESGDDYAVVEIKRHAQYNPRTMQNDVALLKLGRRIMNDAHIGIACLPDEDDDEDEHDGETATLLGWRGIFGTKSRDPEFLEVISNKKCERKLGRKVPSTTLCTETRKESERTCNADSGAPLVIEHDGKYEVIGILSWNRNDCDQRFPSTFSRVSSYTGWIKNHLA